MTIVLRAPVRNRQEVFERAEAATRARCVPLVTAVQRPRSAVQGRPSSGLGSNERSYAVFFIVSDVVTATKLSTAIEVTKHKKPPENKKASKNQKLNDTLEGVKKKIFKSGNNKPANKKAEEVKPAEPVKKSKLTPLKEKPPPKKGDKDNSPRSFYNTFLTEHFENAQITHIVTPFKVLDLAAVFATTSGAPVEQRSTEEMRADTLHKVLDDFPNLILPPLKDIDRSLPYLRELNVQSTPCHSPEHELGFAPRVIKALLNWPLARTQNGTPLDARPLNDTQSIEEEIGPIRVPSRSKAMLQNEVTPRDVSLHEITPREPEPHMLAPPLPLAVSQQRILTGSAAEPVSPASPMVPRKRGRTLRQRLTLRIRKVLLPKILVNDRVLLGIAFSLLSAK
ncbi:hypothetical protein Y032_0050g1994 [Ancylostoma ceylanicum]|uniref:Uncharacterized protein n=1 Tax=Ancylostoma ceylanicum TaxID=53326 RepID=A0A016U8I1_9BILA|nr:hypothetical protein Y032_0050g1994 [Ancylostoma ceylanicum]